MELYGKFDKRLDTMGVKESRKMDNERIRTWNSDEKQGNIVEIADCSVGSAEEEREQAIFGRRSSIRRTPPKLPVRSISDTSKDTSEEDDVQTTKRKRWESPTLKDQNEILSLNELTSLINKVKGTANELGVLVKDNPNTKVEIKRGIAKLERRMDDMVKRNNTTKVNLMKTETRHEKTRKVKETLQKNSGDGNLIGSGEKLVDVKSIGIQTEPTTQDLIEIERGQVDEIQPENIAKVKDFKGYKELAGRPWHRDCYSNSEVVEGSPFARGREDMDLDLVVWVEDEDKGMEEGLQAQFKNRYPELIQMRGRVNKLSTITTFTNGESVLQRERCIYRLEGASSEEENYESLIALKAILKQSSWQRLAIHMNKNVEAEAMRKMCIFKDLVTDIIIHVPNSQGTNKPKVPKINLQTIRVRLNAKKEGEALIVKAEGKTYAELLKKIKDNTTIDSDRDRIEGVRKTTDGDLLIRFKPGVDAAENVKTKLDEAEEGLKIRVSGPKAKRVTMQIKDVDCLITQEEIKQAIQEAIGLNSEEDIGMGKLKPMFGGNTTALLYLGEEIADEVRKRRKIKIGLNTCRVVDRFNLIKCYKCWEYGHVQKNCRGANREKLCMKCGAEGHKLNECVNEENCPLCEKKGHSRIAMPILLHNSRWRLEQNRHSFQPIRHDLRFF